jgi:NAD(P)-dependent dehydrogenase (short-subunit alcohol dehydrogenase family)
MTMEHRLKGRRALITGASRGIGAAIARRLAEEGADIVVTYERSEEAAAAVVAFAEAHGRNASALRADGGDASLVTQAVAEAARALGGLDILVNNAGISRYGVLAEMAEGEIDRMLAINIRGTIAATRAALPHMESGGRIISIGSCLASRVPLPGLAIYAMTKSALDGFTRGLGRELGPAGITVNVVHPGPTDTDSNPADGPGAAVQRPMMANQRYGTPTDVAAMVAFLAGAEAEHITASSFAVDGGVNA